MRRVIGSALLLMMTACGKEPSAAVMTSALQYRKTDALGQVAMCTKTAPPTVPGITVTTACKWPKLPEGDMQKQVAKVTAVTISGDTARVTLQVAQGSETWVEIITLTHKRTGEWEGVSITKTDQTVS